MRFKNNPISFLFAKLWQYSIGNRRNVVFFVFLSICGQVVWLLEPLVVAKVLNNIQIQGVTASTLPTLALYLSLFVLIQVGAWIFHGPSRVLEVNNAFFVSANYRKHLLEGTMALPAAWHTDHHSGDTIDKIEKGTTALFRFSRETFQVISTVMKFLLSYVVLVYYNVHASYILLLMLIFTVLLILKIDKTLIVQLSELYKKENSIAARIYDVISNITTVIILRIEKLVMKSIWKKMLQPFTLYSKHSKLNEMKWFLVSVCASITMVLVMFSYFFINVKAGNVILIGTVYLLYEYVSRIVGIFYTFAYMYGDIVEQKTAIMNAEEIAKEFKEKESIQEVGLSSSWKKVDVRNLRFSYHGREGISHLSNIQFSFQSGEKIAFIGESGSGKTTALKIIRGLYEPQHVDCFLDGVKLANGFLSLGSEIALIPQDPEIFATTIKENITVGVTHSLDYIKKFTDMARFTEVANRLPKKFDSSIVEKGVNLSGGEKQRLALSRGLLASVDKEIVLLDEPTSSVDSRNERLIYENIFDAFKDKVVISSIHRLHLLPLFDIIYLFEKGKIKESGSFSELLKKSKEFQVMWEKYTKSQEK
ncbi:MAG: hypothetical protein A3B90_00970 [Candidatus Magasanikbacteria bacterium RIFCSPHIGHO2_02_FULL_41_13]|uniref:ABC transporter domain-containing protein n=1 Tax=Candidatus Magasanikbacteria bacterium RIFCSPHIGHO2_02_FULL_41_13 TaxID=1798676 RepID=A0A1F6M4S2_9BACT|nr:MAG: hypothetical protein A3B90_00970 [Candidatus Magasanikbacteria bacterium RIFCSPHIGHO2_02_FULL_41_13]